MFMPLRVTLLFNSSVSFLNFCLDDPSTREILMLKSLIVIVSGAINSVPINSAMFMKLGALISVHIYLKLFHPFNMK